MHKSCNLNTEFTFEQGERNHWMGPDWIYFLCYCICTELRVPPQLSLIRTVTAAICVEHKRLLSLLSRLDVIVIPLNCCWPYTSPWWPHSTSSLLSPLSSLSLIPPKLCIHTRRRSVEQGGLLIGTSLIIWSYSVPAVICFDLWSQHSFETTDYLYLVAVIKLSLLSTASAWLESSHSSGDRCVSNVYQNACWYASRVSNPQIRI